MNDPDQQLVQKKSDNLELDEMKSKRASVKVIILDIDQLELEVCITTLYMHHLKFDFRIRKERRKGVFDS